MPLLSNMKFLFYFLIVLKSTVSIAQDSDPAYAAFKEIETTEYKDSPSYYVVNLTMVATDPGMATASWEAHKSLTKFLVELYDPTTNKMFHRKVYREKSISIPASATIKVFPIHLNTQGKPKTTSVAQSRYKVEAKRRKEFEIAMKQLQNQDFNNNNSYASRDIPWRWIFRGIGLLALIIGLIAKFAGKNKSDFKDYDRRNRKP